MEDAAAIIGGLILVTPVSGWEIAAVIIGGITAGLFILVLIAQMIATFATWRAANAAKASVDLAKNEADLRLAPFISVPDLEAQFIKDRSGKVLTRRNPQSGVLDLNEARIKGDPESIVYRIGMKNSGQTAAVNVGHGIGQSFDRDEALTTMRADTGHSGTLVPPASSVTHDIDIPLEASYIYQTDSEHPYFLAFSVAYEDHKGGAFFVEVEWEIRGFNINTLRHSAPEPYSSETPSG